MNTRQSERTLIISKIMNFVQLQVVVEGAQVS